MHQNTLQSFCLPKGLCSQHKSLPMKKTTGNACRFNLNACTHACMHACMQAAKCIYIHLVEAINPRPHMHAAPKDLKVYVHTSHLGVGLTAEGSLLRSASRNQPHSCPTHKKALSLPQEVSPAQAPSPAFHSLGNINPNNTSALPTLLHA